MLQLSKNGTLGTTPMATNIKTSEITAEVIIEAIIVKYLNTFQHNVSHLRQVKNLSPLKGGGTIAEINTDTVESYFLYKVDM